MSGIFTRIRRLFGNRAPDPSPLPPGIYTVRADAVKVDRQGRIKIDYTVLGTNDSGQVFDTNRKIKEVINPNPGDAIEGNFYKGLVSKGSDRYDH